MATPTLNLGILAHVDAGKTTLTERLLYSTGVIGTLGSVDEGTTQTDSLALERERGITIKSAVAAFAIGDLAVNLIDTPGHPDFIAEVERVLSVLDGAVLVISAVEGVQPQTPILFRALQRLRVPTLLFVNKVDRSGADAERVVAEIRRRLTPAAVPMGRVHGIGTRTASFAPASLEDESFAGAATEALADVDESAMDAYVRNARPMRPAVLHRLLAENTARAALHPVYFGSAINGTGVDALTAGIAAFLPIARGDAEAAPSGRAFKIERTRTGERVAYVRLFSGTLRNRDRIGYGEGSEGRITGLTVFDPSGPQRRPSAHAGQIARVWGLTDIRVGDAIGDGTLPDLQRQFAPPTLESIVVPADPSAGGRLSTALAELADQDPLINVRQDDERGEIAVSLYGEVQKEVIGETLLREYGIGVEFRETTTICVERPIGTGEALEILFAMTHANVTGKSSPFSTNPFPATLGLRIEPGPVGSGIQLRLDVDARLVPLYIYRTVEEFSTHLLEYTREALAEGLYGWQVTDCVLTVTDAGYRAPGTLAADFRHLMPIVVMAALEQAGTDVCEPMLNVRVDSPRDSVSGVLGRTAQLGGRSESVTADGDRSTIVLVLPAARFHELQRAIPGLTGGEGVVESEFAGYEPVRSRLPVRSRRTPDPRARDEYLMHLHRRVT